MVKRPLTIIHELPRCDRDLRDQYFHVYTENVADRFFFEVVQRVRSYDAYGALNAPARMAAQAQAR